MASSRRHIIVVVLGDLGRSPRMQYHALSLLQEGHYVSLVGYTGEDLIPELNRYQLQQKEEDLLQVVRFEASTPQSLRKMLPIYYIWRLISLVGGLVYALWFQVRRQNSPAASAAADAILVQNPPALPLLLVAYLYCKYQALFWKRYTKFVIDWHNLGYSMFRNGSMIQGLARQYEDAMGPAADGHLCVTNAMKEFLVSEMKIDKERISVLYDCPPAMFRPLSLTEQHEFMKRIEQQLLPVHPSSWSATQMNNEWQTLLTEQRPGQVVQSRPKRPLLITSSTSWTDDEDFDLLLEAMTKLNMKLNDVSSDLCVLVVITGKGPLKEHYEEKMSRMKLNHVAFQTIWLEPGDYPLILACADLGISLHTSTSGLDLPMKVLDLFGCQTPVCAVDFACLSELVKDGVNGHVFASSQELANQLFALFKDKPDIASAHEYGALKQYSNNLSNRKRWRENWREHALEVII